MNDSINRWKLIAWVNIFAQISGSFLGLSSLALANTSQKETGELNANVFTQKYTIGVGENLESILVKFNITSDLFYVLNPSYRLSNQKLTVGDQVNLPVNPLPREIKAAPKIKKQTSKVEESVAKAVAFTGGVLSQDNVDSKSVSDQLQNTATSMLTNAASNSLQQWLGQYGHARVQLGVDKDFSLKNSQYDFLAPLVDRENSLLFLQNSLHRTDDRTQVNVGLGLRYFANEYMLGGNAFWDYDISRGHSRAGVGLEYWRNYLKLSANNYFRLSNWQESKDLKDYDERAANGWDLRAEAYLPFYPQLGGKLSYEKYYGDEVALFGRDNLQKDPYASTLGLTYTPIPLLTLGAEHIIGQEKENDTKFSAQLNYRLGVPWAQQIDPHAVNSLRSLAGSRYDFVDRNNNIVLEYKKNELIKISLPQTIEGMEGDKIWVHADIVSKYNLQGVDWNADSIIAGGGSLNPNSQGMVEITLPAYNYNGINNYTLSAQATDVNNNQSNTATTTIIVKEIPLAQAQLDISLDKSEALANNQDQIAATVVLLDKNNKPLANQVVTLTVPNGVTLSAVEVTTDANGKATVYLTSSQILDGQIVATLKNEQSKTASTNFKFKADATTAIISELTVLEDNAIANGTAQNKVQAVVKDAQGHILANQTVTFSTDDNSNITQTVTTDANGVAIATLTNVKAGTSNVTASINNSNQTVATHFKADPSTAILSGLTVQVNNAIANGEDTNEVKAVVKDTNGNILANQVVKFTSTTNGVTFVESSVTTNEQGIAIGRLHNIHSGDASVTAMINNSSKTVVTHFEVDVLKAIISAFVVTRDEALADGTSTNEVKATVENTDGDLLVNQKVIFSVNNGGVITNIEVMTDTNGEAKTTLTNTKAGIAIVTAKTNGRTKIVATLFKANEKTAKLSELTVTKDNAIANGSATNEVKALVTDANGNPLANKEVTFTADNSGVIVTNKVTTNANGEALTTLTNTVKGVTNVTASVNNTSKSVATNFTEDTSIPVVSDLTVSKNGAEADGIDINEVKATIKDVAGNLLANQEVVFTVNNGDGKVVTEKVMTNAQGVATASITNVSVENSTVTAALTQNANSTKTADVSFVARVAVSVNYETLLDNQVSDGQVVNKVRLTAVNKNNVSVPGVALHLERATEADPVLSFKPSADVTTNVAGQVEFGVTSFRKGEAKLKTTLNGQEFVHKINFSTRYELNVKSVIVKGHELVTRDISSFASKVFPGAKFQIMVTSPTQPNLNSNGNQLKFSSSDTSAAIVDLTHGYVTIKSGIVDNPNVTITIQDIGSVAEPVTFSFSAKDYYFNSSDRRDPRALYMNHAEAKEHCEMNGGTLASLNELSSGNATITFGNTLLSQWGNIISSSAYPDSDFPSSATSNAWYDDPTKKLNIATGQAGAIAGQGVPFSVCHIKLPN